jgi:hypothetical protein
MKKVLWLGSVLALGALVGLSYYSQTEPVDATYYAFGVRIAPAETCPGGTYHAVVATGKTGTSETMEAGACGTNSAKIYQSPSVNANDNARRNTVVSASTGANDPIDMAMYDSASTPSAGSKGTLTASSSCYITIDAGNDWVYQASSTGADFKVCTYYGAF